MTLFEMHATAQEITNDFEKKYVFAIMEYEGVPHGHIFFDSTNRFYIEDPQNIAMLNMSDVDWEVKAVALIPIERNLFYHNFEEYTLSQMLDWIANTPGVIPYAMKEEEKEKPNDIDTVLAQLMTFPCWESNALEHIGYPDFCEHIANTYDNEEIIDMILFLLDRVKDKL